MEIILNVEDMRKSDAQTIKKLGDGGGITLIARAARAVQGHTGSVKKCAILCGSGNNGSDGLALSLLIKEAGGEPHVFKTNEKCTPDGKFYLEKVKKEGIPVKFGEIPSLSEFETVFECLLGTGFEGTPTGIVKDMINAVNESDAFVVSVDVNSGLSSESGLFDFCVRSDLTVAIGYYKPGHFLGFAKDVIGRLACENIGIFTAEDVEPMYLAENADFSDILRKRQHNSHKGTYGYVTVMGGCDRYAGAVKLANIAACAARSGAGVVRLAVESSLCQAVAPYILESTLCPMKGENGVISFDEKSLEDALSGTSSVAVGMGWGRGADYFRILEYLLNKEKLKLVIDADGLNTLSQMGADALLHKKAKVAITPHPMEFSRLSGLSVSEILSDPVKHAKDFAKKYSVTVLLKGASTVITDGNTTYIENGGCPGMATAGSGDVLSGVLCALHGYNEISAKSLACGARICAVAGEMASKEYGDIAMVASDTARRVGAAIKAITDSFE